MPGAGLGCGGFLAAILLLGRVRGGRLGRFVGLVGLVGLRLGRLVARAGLAPLALVAPAARAAPCRRGALLGGVEIAVPAAALEVKGGLADQPVNLLGLAFGAGP